MPSNQQPTASGSQAPSSSKTTLVRSKSLRLPSSKPKPEPGSSTLTRHGSIRQQKSQAPAAVSTSAKPPLSVLRKPLIKPKPVFSSKSTENLTNPRTTQSAESDFKRQALACRSPSKTIESHSLPKGVTFQGDNYATPSDSPCGFRSDKSHLTRDASWSMPDLAVHLKRLTEEHEKLQVEYARVRMQLLDIAPANPVASLKRELQHLSHSDSHLASIPENISSNNPDLRSEENGPSQEAIIQMYKSEVLKLQEENRKLQRKYWEQVLSSESIEDELNGGVSQQVVDLIDKLEDKEREAMQASGRIQDLEDNLDSTTRELQQCQDALQDYQRMLDDATMQKEKLEKQLKETTAALVDLKENVEFLQEERSTLAEALQETEQALAVNQAEKKLCETRLNDLMTRARKLYAKVQDKNLQLQLLQAELDRTEGQARDMLLSQGAELTMTSMHLSEISISLHAVLNSASDFAANELELQKEMLDEIISDLDSEGEKSGSFESPQVMSPLEDLASDAESHFKILASDSSSPHGPISDIAFLDVHKSLPDLPSVDPPSSPHRSCSSNGCSTDRPVSIVQSIIQAVERTDRTSTASAPLPPASRPSSLQVSSSDESVFKSVHSSFENVGSSSENSVAKISFGRTGAFKPVGTAIPFRPVVQNTKEPSPPPVPDVVSTADDDAKKASLESQISHLNTLVGKLKKVIELSQAKYLTKIGEHRGEIANLQRDLKQCKDYERSLQHELKFKSEQLLNTNDKLSGSSAELRALRKSFELEKEDLLKHISELKEQNKCLEAVNKEQAAQMKEEIHRILDTVGGKQNTLHFSDAVAICDKLTLKQEIAKLKEKVNQKEKLLQTLAQKFTKTKKVLEDNLHKADNEVECLDKVIQNVYELLQKHPDLMESSDVIRSIYNIVSALPDDMRDVYRKDVTLV